MAYFLIKCFVYACFASFNSFCPPKYLISFARVRFDARVRLSNLFWRRMRSNKPVLSLVSVVLCRYYEKHPLASVRQTEAAGGNCARLII